MGTDTPQWKGTVIQEARDLRYVCSILDLPPSLSPDRWGSYSPDPRIFAMGREDMHIPCRTSMNHRALLLITALFASERLDLVIFVAAVSSKFIQCQRDR
jgi:hypothetical protein